MQQYGLLPQMQAQPTAPAQQGLLDRMMGGVNNYVSEPDNMARLAMAFNTLRFQPDQSINSIMASRLKDSREEKLLKSQTNKTIEFLRAKGVPEATLESLKDNPAMLMAVAKEYTSKMFDGGLTDTMQSKVQQARLLGYEEGSPEWNAVVSGKDVVPQGQYSKDQLGVMNTLSNQVKSNSDIQDFEASRSGWDQIQEFYNNQGTVSDYALTIAFAKILDPTSVVREGEQAAIARSGAIDEALRQQLINALNGQGSLPKAVRDDIFARARSLYNTKATRAQGALERFGKSAAKAGLSLDDIYYGGNIQPVEMPAKPEQYTREQLEAEEARRKAIRQNNSYGVLRPSNPFMPNNFMQPQ